MLKEPEELLSNLTDAGLVRPGELRGCTDAEIAELETVFKVSLPNSYKRFLHVMGKAGISDDGGLWSDYLMFDIPTIKLVQKARKDAEVALKYYGYELKPADFVCLYRDSTFCGWFDTTGGVEPPLNVATEMHEDPISYPSFLDYLNCLVDAYLHPEDYPNGFPEPSRTSTSK